jgi:hypothetical protein
MMTELDEILTDIVSSEEHYISTLGAFLESYVNPITAAFSSPLSKALSAHLATLIKTAVQLLKALAAAMKKGRSLSGAFCEFSSDALHAHIAFAERYHDFLQLSEIVDPAFLGRLDSDPANIARCEGLTFDEMLSAPAGSPGRVSQLIYGNRTADGLHG